MVNGKVVRFTPVFDYDITNFAFSDPTVALTNTMEMYEIQPIYMNLFTFLFTTLYTRYTLDLFYLL